MKNFVIILITMLSLNLLLSITNAPPWINASEEDMPRMFIETEDANGDGRVSESEFKGPDNDFIHLDKNKDGFIDLSEAPKPSTAPKMNGIGNEPPKKYDTYENVKINRITFNIPFEIFTWSNLPNDVTYKRQPIKRFTAPNGKTHYYEVVYNSSGNLNWYQAAALADEAGGYLACIGSKEENDFVFNLVSDKKYFWYFDENGEHYGISIGPFLGGYQPEGSEEPAGGWSWLSGEKWIYENWAKDLNDGVIDKDPRPNDQPNDSGSGQPIMGFGEMNLPVSTWGDYMADVGTYGEIRTPGSCYGFIIEYEKKPKI